MGVVQTSPALRGAPAPRFLSRRLLLISGIVIVAMALAALGVSRLLAWPTEAESGNVAEVLLATANDVDGHASAMIDHGKRLEEKARASTGANREHSISDGQHMQADGETMRALARRLRSSAAMLGSHPTQRGSVDLNLYRAESVALVSEGKAMEEHGKAMVAHARYMADLARDPGSGITLEDVRLMEEGATGMVDAGQRAKTVGERLAAFVEQTRRSLGLYP